MIHGEQLQLDLRMPWNGVSPRYLTKAPRKLKLANEGTGRLIRDVPVVQLELFPEGTSFGS